MPAPLEPPSRLQAIRPDGGRLAIHPADVRGRFVTARRVVYAALILIYVAAPLVRIGGHPMVHLDVEARRFFLFGQSYNSQDFWLVLLLGTTFAFALLFSTAWRGRLWCGWACPQTVFLEGVFRPIERLIDGPRERRLRQAEGRWTAGRVVRAAVKHGLYLAVSAFLSHVALSLFLSAKDLWGMMLEGPAHHPVAFTWSVAVTGALYFNYAWFREQLCIVICPYGRLQSSLHDRDSIVIGYDARRGEPRGHAAKGAPADQGAAKLGDCVDCKRCVVVCPTAIDIRNGLQLECIACAQCVDACDEIMQKLKRPTGLIRYAAQTTLQGEPARVLRPRLAVYGALLAAFGGALVWALVVRSPFEANVLRPKGLPWTLDGDRVTNQLDLHLFNKSDAPADFTVVAESLPGVDVQVLPPKLTLAPHADAHVAVRASAPAAIAARRPELRLDVSSAKLGAERRVRAPLLAPGRRN